MSLSAEMGRLAADVRRTSALRKSSIEEMRRTTRRFLTECATVRAEMTRDHRTQIVGFLSLLGKNVAAQRRAAASEMRRLAETRRNVGARRRLEREVRELMSATAAARRTMARRQRSALESGLRRLRTEIARFRRETQRRQQALQADHRHAGAIWAALGAAPAPEPQPAAEARSQPIETEPQAEPEPKGEAEPGGEERGRRGRGRASGERTA